MCEKCGELDDKIEHYQRISRWLNDKTTLDIIRMLIEKLSLDKTLLHLEISRSQNADRKS
jgi:hypothetical protein